MKIPPCMRSGFCCKVAPCPHGKWNADKTACEYLVGDGPGQYECGIYDEIIKKPGWEQCPAFGAGCSSTLFNPDRDSVIRRMGGRVYARTEGFVQEEPQEVD